MKLLTWNIHKGIGGLDRRYGPGRVAEVLRHHDADVVLLQEICEGVPRSGRDDQTSVLAAALGYRFAVFAPNVELVEGRYGNATLSRLPLVQHRALDLTFPMKKPRGALYTAVRGRFRSREVVVHVVNLHLGLSGVERRWQLQRLLENPALRNLQGQSRLVVAGDTNDWAGALGRGVLTRAGFTCVTGRGAQALRTFPSWAPVGSLDRVFVRGPLAAAHAACSRMRLAGQASDHLPVIVELRPERG